MAFNFHCRFLAVAVEGSKKSPELIQLLDMHTHFAAGTPGRRVCPYIMYRNLEKRVLGLFLRAVHDIFLENTPTSHVISLALVFFVHAVTLQHLSCHALAYYITANGVCLHLLVPPLAHCCFCASCLNKTACTAA